MAVYQACKPLPEGIGVEFPLRPASDVRLLTDVTYLDVEDIRHSDQHVFDEALRMVAQARRVIVADMFLFNDFSGTGAAPPLRPLSAQFTHALVERKRAVPGLQVVLITDPINTLYGGMSSRHLDALRAAGIEGDIRCHASPKEAYVAAQQSAQEGDRIVVFGSFMTVADVLAAVKAARH